MEIRKAGRDACKKVVEDKETGGGTMKKIAEIYWDKSLGIGHVIATKELLKMSSTELMDATQDVLNWCNPIREMAMREFKEKNPKVSP